MRKKGVSFFRFAFRFLLFFRLFPYRVRHARVPLRAVVDAKDQGAGSGREKVRVFFVVVVNVEK